MKISIRNADPIKQTSFLCWNVQAARGAREMLLGWLLLCAPPQVHFRIYIYVLNGTERTGIGERGWLDINEQTSNSLVLELLEQCY